MLSKVFGRPLRTMSLYNCYLQCVIAIYYVFYSTVYNLSLSVFLPCWRLNVFIWNSLHNVVVEASSSDNFRRLLNQVDLSEFMVLQILCLYYLL